LRNDRSAGTAIVVSHAEPIRAALLHYARMRLDDFLAIEIDPSSISTLSAGRGGYRITGVNQRVPA